MVDLGYVLNRFNAYSVADWASTLSVGEQQRIGMARLFYHRPSFAILDESTSAVDAMIEEKFYSSCRNLGISYMSVAHRQTCIPYHDLLLRLDGKGGFTISDIPQASAPKTNDSHGADKDKDFKSDEPQPQPHPPSQRSSISALPSAPLLDGQPTNFYSEVHDASN